METDVVVVLAYGGWADGSSCRRPRAHDHQASAVVDVLLEAVRAAAPEGKENSDG